MAALNFNSILLFSDDPESLSSFYGNVVGKKADWVEGGYYGFQIGNCFLTIGPHDKVKGQNPQPERMMINFETDNVENEFERIKSFGAKVIAKPYSLSADENNQNMLIATFEDPDGNFFQLMSPFEQELIN